MCESSMTGSTIVYLLAGVTLNFRGTRLQPVKPKSKSSTGYLQYFHGTGAQTYNVVKQVNGISTSFPVSIKNWISNVNTYVNKQLHRFTSTQSDHTLSHK